MDDLSESNDSDNTVETKNDLNISVDDNDKKKRIRKQTIEWDDEKSIKLVNIVKTFQNLWNHNDKDYKNREVNNNSWDAIGKIMDIPKYEIVVRWNSTRSNYLAYKRKLNIMKSGHGCSRPPKISPIFAAMQFLDAVLKNEPTLRESNTKYLSKNRKTKHSNPYFDAMDFLLPVVRQANKPASNPVTKTVTRPITNPVTKLVTRSVAKANTENEKGRRKNTSHCIDPLEFVQLVETPRTNTMIDVPKYRDDEYDQLGNFISSNMKGWSVKPNIVEKFKEGLYALISETQKNFNRKEVDSQIDNWF